MNILNYLTILAAALCFWVSMKDLSMDLIATSAS